MRKYFLFGLVLLLLVGCSLGYNRSLQDPREDIKASEVPERWFDILANTLLGDKDELATAFPLYIIMLIWIVIIALIYKVYKKVVK